MGHVVWDAPSEMMWLDADPSISWCVLRLITWYQGWYLL